MTTDSETYPSTADRIRKFKIPDLLDSKWNKKFWVLKTISKSNQKGIKECFTVKELKKLRVSY